MIMVELVVPKKSDLNNLISWENDLLNSEFTDFPKFYTKDQWVEFLSSSHDLFLNNQLRYMIKTEREVVGCIDIFDYDLVNSRAGVGIFIDSKWRKKGLAFKAIEQLKIKASSEFLLNQLYATIYSSNKNSLNLFKSSGFVINGTKKQWVRRQEQFEDVHFLQCFL
jgi:diamine N-acetyltransferase